MRNLEKDELEMAARREAMLTEGFRLFSEKGIEAVSMQEVASACGVGVATLYRYYNTKAALAIAISQRQWERYAAYVRARQREAHVESLTAAERLAFYLDFYIELYQDHSAMLRFNQSFNNYVRHEGVTREQMEPYMAAIGGFAEMFHELYEQGRRDGTLRTEIPEEKMFASTLHIMLAVVVRYAQGLLYSADDDSDRMEELRLLKRMILKEYLTG
ncbi:MAG: TetR/AcrR family transcriptional regulator [Clostridia bacterium]|nr:TetR/AcrR family transcriptional regulator [Clostridia bacterium]